jgi:hypothetical protein
VCVTMHTAVLRSARKASGAGRARADQRRRTHEVGRGDLSSPVRFVVFR